MLSMLMENGEDGQVKAGEAEEAAELAKAKAAAAKAAAGHSKPGPPKRKGLFGMQKGGSNEELKRSEQQPAKRPKVTTEDRLLAPKS